MSVMRNVLIVDFHAISYESYLLVKNNSLFLKVLQ